MWDSIPTLRSSKLSLSNFSGVSLLSILELKIKKINHIQVIFKESDFDIYQMN